MTYLVAVAKNQADMLSTAAVATELKVTVRRVQQMITRGQLPAQKLGRDFFIRRADLAKVRVRKTGRPPKK